MPASELIEQFKQLSPPEKEELLSHLFDREEYFLERYPSFSRFWRHPGFLIGEFPSIISTPGVCGGSPRIIRTRIPVWTLERMRQLGSSEAQILSSYPSLRAVDLVQALAYAESHRDQIEKEIGENEQDNETPGPLPPSEKTSRRKRRRTGK